APHPARAERRPQSAGAARAADPAGGGGGTGCEPRRHRWGRRHGGHRLDAARNAVHAAVPIMTLLAVGLCAVVASIAGLHAAWGLGSHWPAESAERLAKAAVGVR